MDGITYRVLPRLELVHFQGQGNVTYGMIMAHIAKLHTDPEWQFHFNTFIDFEDATVNAQLGGFKEYQSYFCELQATTQIRKWAIFTLQDITHQNANMSHLLNSKSIIVDVFQHKDRALNFLGVTLEEFEKEVGG